MPLADGSAAFEDDPRPGDRDTPAADHGGYGPVLGILYAAAGSAVLWASMAVIARWAKHVIF